MALIANMDLLLSGETGHIDTSTSNIPMTKDNTRGNMVARISYGAARTFGTNGALLVQEIIGFEQIENIAPSIYRRIKTFDGSGFSEWLKIG